MSNRAITQASALAALKLSHEAQIEALTAPGLSDHDRLMRFANAIGQPKDYADDALRRISNYGCSVGYAVWFDGTSPLSLFAHLPKCKCPVLENTFKIKYPGIPQAVRHDWKPYRATLERFAKVQQQARFPLG